MALAYCLAVAGVIHVRTICRGCHKLAIALLLSRIVYAAAAIVDFSILIICRILYCVKNYSLVYP